MRTLLAAFTLFTATFSAGPIVEEASAALRQDPVFVHPDASSLLSASDVDSLRAAIRKGDRPIYIAVLPLGAQEEVGGIDQLPKVLGQGVGLRSWRRTRSTTPAAVGPLAS